MRGMSDTPIDASEVELTKAVFQDVDEIIGCLGDSVLKEAYFSDEAHTRVFIMSAIKNDELVIYRNDAREVCGFMIIDYAGMFSAFPFLKLIAVHSRMRNRGIGAAMLSFFEETGFARNGKIFLLAGDFNKDAIRLYEAKGYVDTGLIPSLYRDGFDEHLMMKVKLENG